jgi:flagella basal body P-ring formation protein FlgA
MIALRFFPCLLLVAVWLRAEPSAEPAPASATPPDRAVLLVQLADDLAAHYSLTENLDVDFIRPWSPPAASEGAAPVVATVFDYPEALASSMLVRVRYTQDERILREDTLALRVSLWRESMIAASPLKRGDAVSLHAVTTRRVDALRDRDALPVSAAGEDYVFAREIPAGRTLSWRDVVRRPLVRRGQMIEVQAGGGALVITIKALAMQDGARGEVVRVRNIESKRDFVALVTAENRAEVRL